MDADWSRGDKIAVWSLGVAFTVPGLREWAYRAWHGSDPIDLGDLSNALPYNVPLAPGVVRADWQTLNVFLAATAEVDWDWLRDHDFNEPFKQAAVARVREYSLRYTRPQDEFLDAELERLRAAFNVAATNFVTLALRFTKVSWPSSTENMREVNLEINANKTRQQLQQECSQWTREMNDAALRACDAYEVLVRPARLKLALSKPAEQGAS